MTGQTGLAGPDGKVVKTSVVSLAFLAWAVLIAANFISGEHRLVDMARAWRSFLPPGIPSLSLAFERIVTLGRDAVLLFLLVWGSRGVSRMVLEWLGIRRFPMPVELGLGYGLAALVWLGAGLTGMWFKGIAGGLLLFPAIYFLIRTPPVLTKPWRGMSPYWWLAVPPLLVTLAGAMAPENAFDPLRCHLGLAQSFERAHKIFLQENLVFASYPLNASMVFGWLRMLGGDSTAKLFNWHLLPLLGILASGLAGGGTAGAAVGLALFAVPLVWLQASKSFAELLMACFIACSLVSFINMRGRQLRPALLCGIFLGLALGTKYTAVNAILPLLGLLAMRGRFSVLAGSSMALLLAAGPWLARNYFGEGNPIHPLFSGYFSGPEIATASLAYPLQGIGRIMNGGITAVLEGPWRLFMSGSFFDTYPLGPAVLLMLPALLFIRGKLPPLAVFSVVYLIMWIGLTGGLGRYIVAGLPALFAVAVPTLLPRVRGWAVWACTLGVLVPCALLGAQSVVIRQGPVPFASGCVDRGEYLARRIPDNLRAMGMVTANLPASARFYSFGELVTYYARPEGVSEYEEDRPLIRRLAGESADAAEMQKKFRQRRITAILYNQAGGMTQSAVSNSGDWTPRELMLWQEFLRTRTRLLARWEEASENKCVSLFGITSRPNATGRLSSGHIWPHLPAAEMILSVGDAAMKAGDYRGAWRAYRAATARYPGYAWAWRRMGESLRELGRTGEAAGCREQARKLGG